MMKKMVFILAVVFISFRADGYTSTNYVAPNGLSIPQYTNWATAATNIQDAVNVCSNGGLVLVTNGTYYCWSNSASGSYTSMVTVTRQITIQSVNGPEVTIVDANYPFFTNRCFYITATATVAGFTIQNGHTADENSGGGVYIYQSGMVSNCWITGNSITNGSYVEKHYSGNNVGGGGVNCFNGAAAGQVINCLIYDNIASNNNGCAIYSSGGCLFQGCVISNHNARPLEAGGPYDGPAGWAVKLENGGTMLTNCTVITNMGGGVYISGASTVDTCRIVNNTAKRYQEGAGIYMNAGVVRNSIISGNTNNTAGDGGGISMYGGTILNCVIGNNYNGNGGGGICIKDCSSPNNLIQGCTISGNNGGNAGGGIWFRRSYAIVRNCLIIGNYSLTGGGICYKTYSTGTGRVENCTIVSNLTYPSYSGAGIYCEAGSTGVVINSIIYSNSGGASPNWYTNTPGMSFVNCCTTPTNNLPGSGNITNDPAFVGYAAGNYRLAISSPCINAGTNLSWMSGATDLDSHSRLDHYSRIVDMGCYEYLNSGSMYSFGF